MDVAGIGGASMLWNLLQVGGVSSPGAISGGQSGASDGDGDGSGGGVGAVGSGGLMSSVFQTLNQLGLSLPTQQGASGIQGVASSDGDSDGSGSAGATPGVGHAMHAFMHSLFQALQQANGSSQGTGSSVAGASTATPVPYGGLDTALQGLLQSVGSNSGSAADAQLNTAFQNLVTAMNGNGSAGGSSASSGTGSSANSNSATLQQFLQTLLQNLQSQTGTGVLSASGNLLGTVA